VLRRLRTLGDPVSVAGMARFGINPAKTLGVRIPVLRRMAREIGKDHALALALWKSRYHEARILASMIDAVNEVSAAQMEQWVKDFDSWDVCDQCCLNLFAKTPYAWDKARAWSARRGEFVKRAGFVMMACLAVSDKGAPDAAFARFFPIIRRAAGDGRNFVKKAANWALRQIGKRSRGLRRRAIAEARAIRKIDAPAARWIANDALRELQDPATRLRR
jgi:3-methyladenine DNA glycosylase AlkD